MSYEKFTVLALPGARRGVVSIKPDATIAEATSLMLTHDYSQLPVMLDDREIKGIFSWKSLGRCLPLGEEPEEVTQCMDRDVEVVETTDDVMQAVRKIIDAEYVLVKDKSDHVTGICTLYDIGDLFLRHSQPFVEIERIELSLRELIGKHFEPGDLRAPAKRRRSQRAVSDVSQFTFGDYVHWLEKEENWSKLHFNLDRNVVTSQLRAVNRIRNSLMHFRPGGIDEEERDVLKKISQFLRLTRPR